MTPESYTKNFRGSYHIRAARIVKEEYRLVAFFLCTIQSSELVRLSSMIRRTLICLLTLAFAGQFFTRAQDTSVPDSLKLQQRREIAGSTLDHSTLPQLPKRISFQSPYLLGLTPVYVDTRSWGMHISIPVLPWGLQGSSDFENYIGLGSSRAATIQRDINLGRLSFNAYTSLQGHVYDYQNAIVLVAGGSATCYFSDQWSMTAFGRYATTPGVLFTPAVQTMIPASNFGGYVTYRYDNFYISGGVRREFNPFTNSWETYPIVMPQVKVGDFKIGVDVGPVIKNGIQQMHDTHQSPPPPPPATGQKR